MRSYEGPVLSNDARS